MSGPSPLRRSAEVFAHVMLYILEVPTTSRVTEYLLAEGIDTIEYLVMLTDADVDSISGLPLILRRKLKNMLAWYRKQGVKIEWEEYGPEITQAAGRESDLALADFKKGHKRSVNTYDEFKEDKRWYVWKRHALARAATDGICDVFDPVFTPNVHDRELFNEKLTFAYDMLNSRLRTTKGRACVQRHQDTGDAQKIWEDLLAAYESEGSLELTAESMKEAL